MGSFTGNRFTRQFELDVPIVQGPMGGAAGPELVAAVSNAGGLGVLPVWTLEPERVASEIEATRKLTSRGFAVNIRADLVQIEWIQAAIDAGVSIIHLFWGDPSESMAPITASGARMMATVGAPEAARIALGAGADALVVQGVEAGGHVLSETPLDALLESIAALSGDVPIVAAGGLATAEDVARVMARGASGALLGTRFVATRESIAHKDYKQALLAAGADATARSECFEIGWPDAPHRHLKNSTYSAWDRAGRPGAGSRPGEGDVILQMGELAFPRYAVMPPQRQMSGEIEAAVMYAGMGVERIHACPGAGEVVGELASLL